MSGRVAAKAGSSGSGSDTSATSLASDDVSAGVIGETADAVPSTEPSAPIRRLRSKSKGSKGSNEGKGHARNKSTGTSSRTDIRTDFTKPPNANAGQPNSSDASGALSYKPASPGTAFSMINSPAPTTSAPATPAPATPAPATPAPATPAPATPAPATPAPASPTPVLSQKKDTKKKKSNKPRKRVTLSPQEKKFGVREWTTFRTLGSSIDLVGTGDPFTNKLRSRGISKKQGFATRGKSSRAGVRNAYIMLSRQDPVYAELHTYVTGEDKDNLSNIRDYVQSGVIKIGAHDPSGSVKTRPLQALLFTKRIIRGGEVVETIDSATYAPDIAVSSTIVPGVSQGTVTIPDYGEVTAVVNCSTKKTCAEFSNLVLSRMFEDEDSGRFYSTYNPFMPNAFCAVPYSSKDAPMGAPFVSADTNGYVPMTQLK